MAEPKFDSDFLETATESPVAPKSSLRDGDISQDEGEFIVEKYNWFRGVFFQVTVVGLSAFAAPGLWNAMNAVGAGGQQTPYLVMAGNALLFSIMTFTCLTSSIATNRFGLKPTLIFGTTGYAVYSAALYTYNRYGTEWIIYLGSAACGITSGFFWAAEGAIVLSYPEPENHGKYLAYWLCYRNSGAILGGVINLAFNVGGATTGKLDWQTYIVFVALQCLNPFVAALLSPPEKVRRRNGTRIPPAKRISTRDELKAFGRLAKRKEILLISPLFIYINWILPYSGSYMSLYFSVRARALASLVSAVGQILATVALGSFLDWKRISAATRARAAYIAIMALVGGCWVWGAVVQREYSARAPALDWSDDGFARGWAVYILWQVSWVMTYNFGYWLISLIAREGAEVPRLTSYIRTLESAGQTISSGISSTKTPLIVALGINFGLWAVSVVPAYLVVRKIGVDFHGPNVETEDAPERAETDGVKS